jgi:hypothetical protein
MANAKTPDIQTQANRKTEAEVKSVDGQAGKSNKSNKTSHDKMSHLKAGSHQGAGGGKKQERHH